MKMTIKMLTVLILLTLVAGCKPKGLEGLVPAKGQVLYDAKPLDGAVVTFSPTSGTGRSATATTDAGGNFTLGTMEPKDWIAPGEYQVSVTKYVVQNPMTDEEINAYTLKHDIPPQIISKPEISEKYANFKTSGLTATVPEKGIKDLKFELKSK